MAKRKISFQTACAQYVHRYTGEHVPAHVRRQPIKVIDGVEYWQAPQFATDREWYGKTTFPGEKHLHGNCKRCESNDASWPFGMWLAQPGRVGHFVPLINSTTAAKA